MAVIKIEIPNIEYYLAFGRGSKITYFISLHNPSNNVCVNGNNTIELLLLISELSDLRLVFRVIQTGK